MLTELDTYDWAYAFEYAGPPTNEYGGYGSPDLRRAHPTNATVGLSTFTREDVTWIEAMDEGENDGPDWVIAGQLRDGRYFYLSAGCDYTGWDCQAGGGATLASSWDELVTFGMTERERARLGLA